MHVVDVYVVLCNFKKSLVQKGDEEKTSSLKNQVGSVRDGSAGKRSTELELAIISTDGPLSWSWHYQQEDRARVGTTQRRDID